MASLAGSKPGSKDVARRLKDVEVTCVLGPKPSQVVTMGSLWTDQPVVIHLMRRFGCKLCRGGAKELSRAVPHLVKAGVRCVGVGPEGLGVQEFVAGEFWAGELYVDEGKKVYRAMQLKSMGTVQGLLSLFANKNVRAALKKHTDVGGNLTGDGMQLGATLAIDKGGQMILDYRQQHFADHPSCEELLQCFGIPESVLQDSGVDRPPRKSEECGTEGCGSAECCAPHAH